MLKSYESWKQNWDDSPTISVILCPHSSSLRMWLDLMQNDDHSLHLVKWHQLHIYVAREGAEPCEYIRTVPRHTGHSGPRKTLGFEAVIRPGNPAPRTIKMIHGVCGAPHAAPQGAAAVTWTGKNRYKSRVFWGLLLTVNHGASRK